MTSFDLTNKRQLAKALTEIENSGFNTPSWYEDLFKNCGSAIVIGITGAPGAGKSSLINHLISEIRLLKKTVAVLAIDPSSPFSGGAILGDRTRMIISAEDKGVFIRSSASRGRLGGLSPKTFEMIHILDAAKFDVIIVETVGVGQAEMDVMRCADLVALLLSPHTGDSMQALKAGILEIADIFILNKADLSGINDLEKDLLSSLSLSNEAKPIIRTSALDGTGVKELLNKLLELYQDFNSKKIIEKRRGASLLFELNCNLSELLLTRFSEDKNLANKKLKIEELLKKRSISPLKAAKELSLKALSTGN